MKWPTSLNDVQYANHDRFLCTLLFNPLLGHPGHRKLSSQGVLKLQKIKRYILLIFLTNTTRHGVGAMGC